MVVMLWFMYKYLFVKRKRLRWFQMLQAFGDSLFKKFFMWLAVLLMGKLRVLVSGLSSVYGYMKCSIQVHFRCILALFAYKIINYKKNVGWYTVTVTRTRRSKLHQRKKILR